MIEYQGILIEENDGNRSDFRALIGPPIKFSGDEHRCRIEVHGLGYDLQTEICGLTAAQAVFLSMRFVNRILFTSNEYQENRMFVENEDRSIERIDPEMFGKW